MTTNNAIEHAEYMAKAAERYMEQVGLSITAQAILDAIDRSSPSYEDDVASLNQSIIAERDAYQALKLAIFQFRKRAGRQINSTKGTT